MPSWTSTWGHRRTQVRSLSGRLRSRSQKEWECRTHSKGSDMLPVPGLSFQASKQAHLPDHRPPWSVWAAHLQGCINPGWHRGTAGSWLQVWGGCNIVPSGMSWPYATMIRTLISFLTTPLLPPQFPYLGCTIILSLSPLFPFCLFPCTFTTASPPQPGSWLIVTIVAALRHCSLTFQFLPYDSWWRICVRVFTISCGLSTISIALVSVVDLSFVFVFILQSTGFLSSSVYTWSLRPLLNHRTIEPLTPLNPQTLCAHVEPCVPART